MVIESVLALFALLPSQAVVRIAHGPVAVTSTGAATTIETGADGFAEVHLHPAGRLRFTAGTRAVITAGEVRLVSGRVWAQVGTNVLAVETLRHRAEIGPRASAIVERTTGGGTSLAVRAGRAVLSDREGARRELEAGYTVSVLPGVPGVPEPRTGGRSTGELVTVEARRALGDPLGIEAFLLRRAQQSELAASAARGVHEQVRASSEVTGAERGAFGGLVEESFRPPPFFEAEVPPKGPNVRIEVEFSE